MLMKAKRGELVSEGVSDSSSAAICKAISREELACHCWRRTRGVTETTELIEALVLAMTPATDVLGVRLFKDRSKTSGVSRSSTSSAYRTLQVFTLRAIYLHHSHLQVSHCILRRTP